jgi:hypothetical protein
MGIATIFGIGVLVGTIVTNIIFRAFLVGTLRIDKSDPNENPYMFLELSKGMNAITNKNYVILKINVKSLLPHK